MDPSFVNTVTLIAFLANLVLGLVVYVNNPARVLNRAFIVFSLVTASWIFSNYLFFSGNPSLALLKSWYAIGAGVLPAALVWVGIMVHKRVPWRTFFVCALIWIGMAVVVYIPDLVLKDFRVSPDHVYEYVFGPLFSFYSVIFVVLYLYLVYTLLRGIRSVVDERRAQLLNVLVGVLLWGLVTMVVSFVLPLFGFSSINSYDAQSSLFFVVLSAYAILRHQLFDVKIITTEFFTFSLWAAIGTRLAFATNTRSFLFDMVLLAFSIVFGIFLIRSVKREVENREKGERLARYLANANARLRELDKQKTEFVSIASHQLRSPIAAIVGYSSNIADGTYGAVPETLKQPVARVLESGRRISLIVDDFLNVSRIEQGRMTYDMQRHDLAAIVAESMDELKIFCEQKGISFELERPNVPIEVVGDEGKLKQIFSNLVDNALKYTHQGFIRVTVKMDEAHTRGLVAISDSGIGIAADEVDNLFHKFNRASNANTANVHGTGLGLYIAKEIMKAHKGWIHVSSEGIGKGSTFTVDLPLAN